MSVQIIFCVEANSQSKSDYIYIKSLLQYRYSFGGNQPKYKPVFMNSKSRYNQQEKIIQRLKKMHERTGPTRVVMCVDEDNGIPDSFAMNPAISAYCRKMDFDLVWFRKDIEDVFIHKEVASKEQGKTAASFASNKGIGNVNLSDLNHKIPLTRNMTSNLITILDPIILQYGGKICPTQKLS